MSSSAKKKQDDKNLQLLKAMVALPNNKQCFDCGQKGPTYINLTIGSFVCMTCSGILRGINPPHRVKSITMSSFTNDELEFIRSRGNYFCKQVWLGSFQEGTRPADLSNDQNKKDFLCVKYERRQWYVEPSPNLFGEAKALTDSALAEVEQASQAAATRGQRAYSNVSNHSGTAPVHHHTNGSHSVPRITNIPPTYQQTAQQRQINTPLASPQAPPQPKPQPNLFDDDLETTLKQQNVDPRFQTTFNQPSGPPQPVQPQQQQQQQQPPPPPQQQQQQTKPFADFADFGNVPTSSNGNISQPTPVSVATNGGNKNAGGFASFADFDSAFAKSGNFQSEKPAPVIVAPPPDRYKALEELDDLLALTGTTGVVSSGIDWGVSSSQNQPNTSTSQHSSVHQTSAFPPMQSNANFGSVPRPTDPFNTSGFGQTSQQPLAPPPYSAKTPFGHQVPQTSQSFTPNFSDFPHSQSQPNGFGGYFPATQPQNNNGFGAFPASTQSVFPAATNPFTAAPQQPPISNNPFMAAASMPFQPTAFGQPQTQAPAPLMRPSVSNNPFL